MNELWNYKVDPERFASWLEPGERKIVGLKDESQKKKFNIDGTNEKENETWNEWEQEGQSLIKQLNS